MLVLALLVKTRLKYFFLTVVSCHCSQTIFSVLLNLRGPRELNDVKNNERGFLKQIVTLFLHKAV